MDVASFLKKKARRVEIALDTCLNRCHNAPPGLIDAMRYSLLGGGKRLRPALALGACEIVSGKDGAALPAACALEMIHTYSLIHDDLPAMDNDDVRRGRPTSHKQYDEATAILAGDALLTLAFHEASTTGNIEVVAALTHAAGASGMVGGQYLDMHAQGKAITIEALQDMHAGKTGALITVSVRAGALLGNVSQADLDALTIYGQQLGLLFQITDDILDITGDVAVLGKSTGKDQHSAKATYPALLGLDTARDMARVSAEKARAALDGFGDEADVFRALPQFILNRDR